MDLYLPFNSVDHDRIHTAEDIADMYACLMTDGVHPTPGDSLFVAAAGGWNIYLFAGRCVIRGRLGFNKTSKTMTVNPPDSALGRIDRVVLRCDYVGRKIVEMIKEGDPASSPVAPNLQRDWEAYEICLAEVSVKAKATEITQADIRDTRQNFDLCGVVNSLIEVDPDTLFAQYEAAWAVFAAEQKAIVEKHRREFEEWLHSIKVMSEEGENNALARIASLQTDKADKNLQFFNVQVPVTLWVADTAYEMFPFRADVPLWNAEETMIPRVVFGGIDAVAGNLSPIAMAMDGGVRIYAQSVPEGVITIPTITMEKAV